MNIFYIFIIVCLFQNVIFAKKLLISKEHSTSLQCNGNGYFYQDKCFCFSQYKGKFCSKKKTPSWFQSDDKCDQILERLDNLMNINPKFYENDDNEFPRLKGNSIGFSQSDNEVHVNEWTRMHDMTQNFKIFGKKISAKQFIQGDLGNCYFISAVSSIVNIRNGELIKNIFQTKEDNDKHVYVTKWLITGKPKYVAVDDWIPNDNIDPLIPRFSQAFEGNIFWSIILEKAWAKIHGNYQDTDTGGAFPVFEAILSARSDFFLTYKFNPTTLYEKIKYLLAQDFPVNSDTYSKQYFLDPFNQFTQKQQKLIPQHSYAILNAYEVQVNQKEKQQLIKVFNPWNKETWIDNPWGRDGDKWTEDMKQKYDVDSQNGVFHLTSQDYFDQFSTIVYSQNFKDYDVFWHDISFQIGIKTYHAEFHLLTSFQQLIQIYLDRGSERLFQKSKCEASFQYVKHSLNVQNPSLQIFQDKDNKMQVDISKAENGNYHIYIDLDVKSRFVKYFTLTVFAPKGSVKFVEKFDQKTQQKEKQCKNECNGKGTCNTFNGQCKCYIGYEGEDCSQKQQFKCPNDCNGNGDCILGICQCKQGYYKKDCQPCEDLSEDCLEYVGYGFCEKENQYIQYMKENCQKTCGMVGYKYFECYLNNY